jgi:Protein of unknown function (DUF1460)
VYSGKWITGRSIRFAFGIAAAFLLFISSSAYCQVSHVDDSIFAAKIKQAKAEKIDTLPIGERIAAMGNLFLGTPYVAHTLDADPSKEQLVIDLRGFDCVTFYENTLAFARILKFSHPTMQDLKDMITYIRYCDGKMDGFHSRLNYTIDYFYNNEQKRVISNITRDVGGQFVKYDDREIHFMTTHRSLYKQLAASDSEYAAMLGIEGQIHARKDFYYIPKSDVSKIESNILTGDILGITTNIPDLDCSHTGIAIKMGDGRIHFMHASSLTGKVIISDEPLAEYLTHSSHQTGIIIARPRKFQVTFTPE